jgi:hypothetical protein
LDFDYSDEEGEGEADADESSWVLKIGRRSKTADSLATDTDITVTSNGLSVPPEIAASSLAAIATATAAGNGGVDPVDDGKATALPVELTEQQKQLLDLLSPLATGGIASLVRENSSTPQGSVAGDEGSEPVVTAAAVKSSLVSDPRRTSVLGKRSAISSNDEDDPDMADSPTRNKKK